jgi:hypothetical protein
MRDHGDCNQADNTRAEDEIELYLTVHRNPSFLPLSLGNYILVGRVVSHLMVLSFLCYYSVYVNLKTLLVSTSSTVLMTSLLSPVRMAKRSRSAIEIYSEIGPYCGTHKLYGAVTWERNHALELVILPVRVVRSGSSGWTAILV